MAPSKRPSSFEIATAFTAFGALAFAVAAALGTMGCAAEGLDDDDADAAEVAEADASELSRAGGIEVIQVNPFYAGAYERPSRSSDENWRTAHRFARAIHVHHTHAAVIGMEEVESAADAEQARDILEKGTGRRWRVRWFGSSPSAGTGEAIFWRPAVMQLDEDLGQKTIDRVDGKNVTFGGVVLRRRGTSKKLAVFAGKLAWWGSESEGERTTNDDRADAARVLREWATDQRGMSHVVMMDMNAKFGSEPYRVMKAAFDDDHADEPTYFARGKMRLDYVFSDRILGHPEVSGDFGSDHRFVAAKVYLR